MTTSPIIFVGIFTSLFLVMRAETGGSRACPQCQAALPFFRWPDSWSQATQGGWTCCRCGCKIDRLGNRIA